MAAGRSLGRAARRPRPAAVPARVRHRQARRAYLLRRARLPIRAPHPWRALPRRRGRALWNVAQPEAGRRRALRRVPHQLKATAAPRRTADRVLGQPIAANRPHEPPRKTAVAPPRGTLVAVLERRPRSSVLRARRFSRQLRAARPFHLGRQQLAVVLREGVPARHGPSATPRKHRTRRAAVALPAAGEMELPPTTEVRALRSGSPPLRGRARGVRTTQQNMMMRTRRTAAIATTLSARVLSRLCRSRAKSDPCRHCRSSTMQPTTSRTLTDVSTPCSSSSRLRKRRAERGRGAALIRIFRLAHCEPGNLMGICNVKGRGHVHGLAAFQALRVSTGWVVVLRCAEHMRLVLNERRGNSRALRALCVFRLSCVSEARSRVGWGLG